ncbi:MAG: YfhO family protein [Bacteroidetes bacterium]|jgi:hypothetical protein|nr:YfhO family protein [Bacteroidota bacterium]
MKMNPKLLLQHLGIIVFFIVISFIYFYPVLEGKGLRQGDITQAKGMQREIVDQYEKTGKRPLWTNSMFSGMPTYQISTARSAKFNIFQKFNKFIRLNLPSQTVDAFFLYLICFYIMLLVFGVNRWLSIIGALAFALSSYNIIIIGAGHINKAYALGVIPLILAGMYALYDKRYLLGSVLVLIGVGIELSFNHVQMTYYAYLLIGIYILTEVYHAINSRQYRHFMFASLIFIGTTLLAVLPNITNLWATYEYSKDTIRGGSELVEEEQGKEGGLDKDYALAWSYGKAESLSLLIPNIHGGASHGGLTTESNLYKTLIEQGVPSQQAKNITENIGTYWGDQSFTEGPVYFGAIIVFLFVLGLFIVKNNLKWWLFVGSLFSIFLAMGENFQFLTNFFFNHFPLYNKFRSVSSILTVASFAFPLMALLALQKIYQREISKEEFKKGLKYALAITGGLIIFILVFGKGMFSFQGPMDQQYLKSGYPQWIIDALREDRIALLRKDSFRSLVFILVAAGFIYFYFNKKLKANYFIIGLGFFTIIDLWGVDRRYVHPDEFVEKKQAKEIQPNRANLQIMQDSDPHFRVFNLTANPFTETRTSYFHNSLGGYHGAKLSRYQDLIEHHLSKQNMDVINMLNTKYLIVPGDNNQPLARQNQQALGNAWLVNNYKIVDGAREEIEALNDFNPGNTAIIDRRFISHLQEYNESITDSLRPGEQIKLTEYNPDSLTYESHSNGPRIAVFSEVYYNDEKGWKAYINGKHTPHFRVNYVLRGLVIPEGEHTVKFKFEPQTFFTGQKIAGIGSIITLILIISAIFTFIRMSLKEQNNK